MDILVPDKGDRNGWVDMVEAKMLSEFPAVDLPINELYTDGLYAREMLIPVQSNGFEFVFLTSEIHLTEHMFYVGKGSLLVSTDDGEPVLIKAPYHGITKPGTRRVALALEDTIWTTFHANPNNLPWEELKELIMDKRQNPLLTDELKNKMLAVKDRVKISS
jgi:hypothetical protein